MNYRQKVIKLLEKETKLKTSVIDSLLEKPPSLEFGDFAFPCFSLSKKMKKAPHDIAEQLLRKIKPTKTISKIETRGPYLNFFINRKVLNKEVLESVLKEQADYGHTKGKKSIVLVESPGPNTNKPLHIGHLRNILLGSSITKILESQGKEVHIVNVINDRGVHICKSMLAYQKYGKGKTPERAKMKSDHFVGDFYVKYAQEEKKNPKLAAEVQELLVKWEDGDKETLKLWKQMNSWALKGFAETYKRLGFKIEKEYLESDTYKHGKDIILKGLKKGIFQKDEEGAILFDLEKQGLGNKVLLRSNGTSVYITQDIYMAKKRQDDFKFDEMIYVVGNEQEYHFKVLFNVFKALGWKFADKCIHFSYGMVELPDGKMKSREGTVVDTDNLITRVEILAIKELHKRYSDLSEKEIERRVEIITMGAVRFFFLKFDPMRNFVFNPKESLSFEGETGPYIQYAYARINSILRKNEHKISTANYELLKTKEEQQLIKNISEFPNIVSMAAKSYKPSIITNHLLELAQTFNEFYHKSSILKSEPKLRDARLILIRVVAQVLKNGLALLGIEVPRQM